MNEEILPGEVLIDMNSQVWKYSSILLQPEGESEGRIMVRDEHDRLREFYPSVFDCVIVDGKLYHK